MNESLEPLPQDIIEKLSTLSPPPAPASLAAELLPSIRAAGGLGAAVPWWMGKVPAWLPVATLVAGAAGGLGVGRLLAPEPTQAPLPALAPAPRVVEALPPPQALAPPPAPVVEPVSAPRKERRPPAIAAPAPAVEEPEPPPPDRLREERVLIDIARAALRRNPEDGLVALDQHQRAFPAGQLSEEREALAVQLLLLQGRRDEARKRLEAFALLFPASSLVTALAPNFAGADAGR